MKGSQTFLKACFHFYDKSVHNLLRHTYLSLNFNCQDFEFLFSFYIIVNVDSLVLAYVPDLVGYYNTVYINILYCCVLL